MGNMNNSVASIADQASLVRVKISFERGNASVTLEELGVSVPANLTDFAARFLTGGIFRLCPVEKVNALQSIAVTMRNAPLKYGFRSEEFRGIVVKAYNVPDCVARLEELRSKAIEVKESILSAYDVDREKIESRCMTFARIAYATSIGQTDVSVLQTWEEEGYENSTIRSIAAEMRKRIPSRAAFAQRFKFEYSVTALSFSQGCVSLAEYNAAVARIAELEDTPENREERQRLEILRAVHEASAESAKREYEAQVSELISLSVTTVRQTVLDMIVELNAAVKKEGKVTKRHTAKLAAMRDAARMLAWDGDTFPNYVETATANGENMTDAEMRAMLENMRAGISNELLAQNEERIMREDSPDIESVFETELVSEETRVLRLEEDTVDTVEHFEEEARILRE